MRYQLHTSQSRCFQNVTVATEGKGNLLVESNFWSQIFVKIKFLFFYFFILLYALLLS